MVRHYQRVRHISTGRFGLAILVQDAETGKLAVMKAMDVSSLKSAERLELLSELQCLAKLRHPHLCGLSECFLHQGKLCKVMDYLPGGNLATQVAAGRDLGDRILLWFTQALLAVDYLHRCNVLHRDLRLRRLLLTRQGLVVVTGVALSAVLKGMLSSERRDMEATRYLAPEILLQNEEHSSASDMWALGVILYELIALKPPWEHTDLALDLAPSRGAGSPRGRNMSKTRVLATVLLAAVCQADCTSDASDSCAGQGEEDWADSNLPHGFSAHSSFVKCLGATAAGSVFALLGKWIESRKEQKEKPICREDLKLPRSGSRLEEQAVPQPDGEPLNAQIKRSQSLPSAELQKSRSRECKDTPKARSDEDDNWRSANGRLPRTVSAPAPKKSALGVGKDVCDMEKVERQVKSILNKLTWEKFDKLYADLLTYCMVEHQEIRHETIEVIARDVFKKATLQHNFIELYADLCARLDADFHQKGVEVNFRRALLQQCQESFTVHLAPPEIDTCLDYEEQYEMLVKYKTKMLGNVKLIAHLLRLRMLAAKIIFHCIDELISIGSAEALETLCAFLDTLGSTFDKPQWSGYARWEEVFRKVKLFTEDKMQSARTRCLLKDLLDKRQNGWQEKKVHSKMMKDDKVEKVEKKTLNGADAKMASSPFSNGKVEKNSNGWERKVWTDGKVSFHLPASREVQRVM